MEKRTGQHRTEKVSYFTLFLQQPAITFLI